MDTGKIYRNATIPKEILEQREAEKKKLEADSHFAAGLAAQNYQEWLNHSVTKKLMEKLSEIRIELIYQAELRSLHVTDDNERNQIVKLLAMAACYSDMANNIKNVPEPVK